jgi:hypothetical protein
MPNPTCDPQGLHRRFASAVGPSVLKAIGAVVAWAHVRAPEIAQELYGDFGLLRSGCFRWTQIDAGLKDLQGKFPGVDFNVVPNPNSSGSHIEIIAGDFRLLLAHDADPRTLVPKANYGRTLARSNAMSLFPEPESAEPLPPPQHYVGILFHSKSTHKGQVPICLEVRFPDGADDGYAAPPVNLYESFPNLMDEVWLRGEFTGVATMTAPAVDVEHIKEEAMPMLRQEKQSGT